jgi:hypothetical protein
MTARIETDLTLPLLPEAIRSNTQRPPLSAYAPIAVALVGVAMILVGGLQARSDNGRALAAKTIDLQTTSAIARRDVHHDLKTLDL